ncbi:protein CDV3 homolog isoform X2 [Sphaerodactylus townsendi]|uniref:protein CDV3 homolog isoform X2 n=1 Tax=Sphaerodactylus townsendi TaxID=933632 RepID=UPI0020260CC7|nr:protein CDV3 homolog isoform X2 [Sphaerodactylus townsendi]
MAETEERSLDDFFAKRDKKKRKEKSSRTTAATAASSAVSSNAAAAAASAAAAGGVGGSRQSEGGSGAAVGANTAASAAAATKAGNKEEDDWKEFEQEEIDYSGLRVQSMQISEKDDDEGEKREEPRDYSEEPGSGVDKSSGPWNRSSTAQTTPVVETVESPEPVQSSGVYRPPGARETRTRKAPQGPPEIYSDTQFPSLQSTAKHVDTRKY